MRRAVWALTLASLCGCGAHGDDGGLSTGEAGDLWTGVGRVDILHASGELEQCRLPGMILQRTAGAQRTFTVVATGANCTLNGVAQSDGSIRLPAGQTCVVTTRRGPATLTTGEGAIPARQSTPSGLSFSGAYVRHDGLDRGTWLIHLSSF